MLEFVEEKKMTKVTLTSIGQNKDDVCIFLKEALKIGLTSVMKKVETLPLTILEEAEDDYADSVVTRLEELGATVEKEEIEELSPEEQRYQDLIEKIDNLPSDWVTADDLKWLKIGIIATVVISVLTLVLIIVK